MKKHSRNFSFSANNDKLQSSKRTAFHTITKTHGHQKNYSQLQTENGSSNSSNPYITAAKVRSYTLDDSIERRKSDIINITHKIKKIQNIVNGMFQEKIITENLALKNTKYGGVYHQTYKSQPQKMNKETQKNLQFYSNSNKDKQNSKTLFQGPIQSKITQSKLNVFSRFQIKDSPKNYANDQTHQLQNIISVQKQLLNQSIQNVNKQYYRKFSLNNNYVRQKYLGLQLSRTQKQLKQHKQQKQSKQNKEQKQNIKTEETSYKKQNEGYKLKNGKNLNDELKRIQLKMQKLSMDKKNIIAKDCGKDKKYNIQQFQNVDRNSLINNHLLLNQSQRMQNLQVRNVFSPINNNSSKISQHSFMELSKQNQIKNCQVIEALSTQFRLDQIFRKAKKWFCETKIAMKWEYLAQTLARKGIKMNEQQLKNIFICQDQQKDPFYSSREEDETIKSLVQKFLNAQRHWMRNLHHQHRNLQKQGFTQQNLDHYKKGFVTIQELVTFINLRTRGMYSTRDAYLIFNRLKKGPKLSYNDILQELSTKN